ncbi:MAG: hypothetical protein RIR68_1944 [Pseudomonadota bacterium]
MSAKKINPKLIVAMANATVLSCMLGVSDQVLADPFPYGLQDPLQTQPNVLKRRNMFLGDETALACAASNSEAQSSLQSPLLLTTAVDMAMCQSPQVRTAWAAIKIQAGALGEARAAYVPTLNGTINRGITKYANLSWRLFDFGTRSANLESANHMLTAATASHDAAVQKMLNSVVAAYFDVMTAQATHKAREEAVELAMGTWQATQRRETKGVAASSDNLQAGAALAKAKLALSRAQGDVQKTQSVLLYTMGSSMGRQLILPNDEEPKPELHKQELNQWLLDAQQLHPAIHSARAQFLASQAKVRVAQAEGLPSLDYTQNFYQNGYPNQGLLPTSSTVTTVGLTLNVPLFEGFARTYKVRGAQAQSEQIEAQLRDAELQVLMEVVKAHADTLSSIENLQTSNLLLEAANASRQSSQKRYDNGVADVLELLSTQNALADAQQERVRCLAEWRSANLRLLASTGMMYRTHLK